MNGSSVATEVSQWGKEENIINTENFDESNFENALHGQSSKELTCFKLQFRRQIINLIKVAKRPPGEMSRFQGVHIKTNRNGQKSYQAFIYVLKSWPDAVRERCGNKAKIALGTWKVEETAASAVDQ
jgi:hypothetical protein